MSSSTKSLAKLTSLSTQTLSLLLERQRLQSFPSASLNLNSQPKSTHAGQITRNLQQLRAGILEMEGTEGRTEAVMLLRGQYERMRSMLGNDADGINAERSVGNFAPKRMLTDFMTVLVWIFPCPIPPPPSPHQV